MTTVEDLMQRASKMIDEDPDQARKFGGIYKFALWRWWTNIHRRPDR